MKTVTTTVDIDATPEDVWATLTDFEFLERKARAVDVVPSVHVDANQTPIHTVSHPFSPHTLSLLPD
jgi:carbon monoxide dehydrogenase subunit G